MIFVFSHMSLYTQKTAIVSILVAIRTSMSVNAFLFSIYLRLSASNCLSITFSVCSFTEV